MTYKEHLLANGATEDECKVLVSPLTEKAFAAQQAAIATAAQSARDAEKASWDEWYNNKLAPEYTKLQNEALANAAEAGRANALLKAAQEKGLIDVALNAGAAVPAAVTPPTAGSFDEKRYYTRDEVNQLAEGYGKAIAISNDIVMEHRELFPDQKLNMTALRDEAAAKKIPVVALWEQKFGVPAARTARAAAEKKTYEDALIKKGREEAATEFASRYGQPDVRPLMPSRSPFTKPAADPETSQPWDRGDASVGRVQRATQRAMERVAKPN